MKGYSTSIEEETRRNSDFRRVLYTGKYSQLVLMNLKPLEGIGLETHAERARSSPFHIVFFKNAFSAFLNYF